MTRIKEILREKGMTVNDLADKVGVSRQALSKQIKGKMLVETADKIATALGVPLWQLFASPSEVKAGGEGVYVCPECGARLRVSVKKEE